LLIVELKANDIKCITPLGEASYMKEPSNFQYLDSIEFYPNLDGSFEIKAQKTTFIAAFS
jgi:hypothetical protein